MKKTIFAATLAAAAVLATSCGGEQTNGYVAKGNTSKMDSLSYALGANIAFSVSSQMSDVPFDFTAVAEALTEAAFEKNSVSHDEAVEILQDYFMNKRQDRRQQIAEARQAADSVAIANGADPATLAAENAALKADAAMFESEAERKEVSSAFGIDLGTNLKNAEIPIQTYWINKAMADVNEGASLLDNEASIEYLNKYFNEVRPAEIAAISVEKMKEIAKEKGVQSTESGILYRIEKEGEELKATNDSDVVKVFYTGKLVRNGELFDTNRFADRSKEQQEAMLMQNPDAATADEPIEFPLDRVIAGWTEGMKLVGKGGRISLWIPSELAYGASGAGRAVGPNEALYFDVELVDVTPVAPAEAE